MTEREAMKQKLTFTGKCAPKWDSERYEKLKQQAKEIRNLGFRAVLVNESDDYCSIYTDNNYDKYMRAIEYKQRLEHVESSKQRALEEYQRKIAEIEKEEKEYREYIQNTEKELNRKI